MEKRNTAKQGKSSSRTDSPDPVHVVREGAVAASVWCRQAPSGYAYYDYSLSRSWKSMTTEKTGYSKNFFDKNEKDLVTVVREASRWIANQPLSVGKIREGNSGLFDQDNLGSPSGVPR